MPAKRKQAKKTVKAKTNPTTPGAKFTKTITRGPNKGDEVAFRVARGGKPYPTRVLKDVGSPSTLRGDVPFGKGRTTKKKAKKSKRHR